MPSVSVRLLLRTIVQDIGPNVHLSVLVSPNNVPALALYRRAGFQPEAGFGEYAGHNERLSLVLRTTA